MDYVFGKMKSLHLYHLVLVVAVYSNFVKLAQSCGPTSCPNGGTCQSPNNCLCAIGFAPPDCSDIDECILGTSGCEQTCTNTVGSFQCGCSEGYMLDNDEKTCLAIVVVTSCTTVSFGPSFTNVALNKAVNVTMSSQYNDESMASLLVNGIRDWYWPCASTQQSNNPYMVIDLGQNYSIHSMYVLNRRGWTERLTNLTIELGLTLSAMAEYVYHSGEVEAECTFVLDTVTVARYVRVSIVGYSYLTLCQLEVYSYNGIDDCVDVECQNGGTCVNGIDSYTCSCVTGFTETHCQSDLDECSHKNGGCEHVCNNLLGSHSYHCNTGYEGLQTDGQIYIDECETSTSGCQQTCYNTVGSYNCGCNTGYNLNVDRKSCIDNGDCLNIECQNGGACVEGIDGYTCSCVTGFTGQHCQSDIDECKTSTSGCQQTCTNTVGSYNCGCNTGYNLNVDQKSCYDIGDCEDVECQNGGTCVDGIDSYTCTCVKGFTGQHCESDIDECETSSSGCQQTCNNTVGSYNCGCNTGYNLNVDRKSCYDVTAELDEDGYKLNFKIEERLCCQCKDEETDTSNPVLEHGEIEEPNKGSGILIGVLVGAGVVISVVIAGIVIIRWKRHQRKPSRTLQTETSFVSLSMVQCSKTGFQHQPVHTPSV